VSECVRVSSCGCIFFFAPEHEVAQHRRVVMQWVPAYCGLPGNEKADELAKLGAKGRHKTTVSPSKKRRPSSEQPWGNALKRMTSTPLNGGIRLWSWDHALDTTDSVPTCSKKWSWHYHQSATGVLKTRRPNIYCRDAHFCRQQDKLCGQRQSSYTPNSTAARRNWRRHVSHVRLADWTLSVAAIEKKKKKK